MNKKILLLSIFGMLFLFGFLASVHATSPLINGLTTYYKMEDASGNLTDSTGSFPGVAQGTATYSQTGKILNAIQTTYSGNPSANRFDATVTTLSSGTNTVEFWFKRVTAGNGFGFFDNRGGSSGMAITIESSNNIYCGVNGAAYFANANYAWTPDTNWHQIICVYNNPNIELWIDGTNVANGTWDGRSIANSAVHVFSADTGTSYTGTYLMDEFALANRSWDGSDISTSYNLGSGSTYPFVAGPLISLIYPTNSFNASTNSIDFQASVNASAGETLQNVSLYIDNSYNETNSSGIEGDYSFPKILSDGNHNWLIQACDTSGCSNSSLYNFSIDTTAPNINISSPNGTYDLLYPGKNMTLNTTISDNVGIDSAWYVYQGNKSELSNSSISVDLDQWNFINGTITTSPSSGPNRLDVETNYGAGQPYLLSSLYSSNGIYLSDSGFESNPDCLSENYSQTYVGIPDNTSSNRYICLKSTGGHYYLIKGISFNGYASSFTSYDLNTPISSIVNNTLRTTYFPYGTDFNSIRVYANDTSGNLGNSTKTWYYKINFVNQTYNNETTEGNIENFNSFVKVGTGYNLTSAKLNYSGTLSNVTLYPDGSQLVELNATEVTIPNVNATQNLSFFWKYYLNDSSIIDSQSYNQTVYNIDIGNCSTYPNPLFNFTGRDEEDQSVLSNFTLEVALDIYTKIGNRQVFNFSSKYTSNPTELCISDLPTNANYTLDGVIKYSSDAHVTKYYNYQDFSLTGTTPLQQVNLYDLNSTKSTEFQLTFYNSTFLAAPGVLVYVKRQYVSENQFKTVELPITDSKGQAVLHLVTGSVVYDFVMVKNSKVLATFTNVVAFCSPTTGACTLSLSATDNSSSVYSYNSLLGIDFSNAPLYNTTSKEVSFSYNTPDGSTKTVTMQVTRSDVFGNTSICNDTLTSSGGKLICNVGNISDSHLIVTIYVEGVPWLRTTVSTSTQAYGSIGYVALFFLTLGLILLLGDSKNGVIIATLAGYAVAVGAGWIIGGLAGVGTAGIWSVVLSGAALYKVNKNRGY